MKMLRLFTNFLSANQPKNIRANTSKSPMTDTPMATCTESCPRASRCAGINIRLLPYPFIQNTNASRYIKKCGLHNNENLNMLSNDAGQHVVEAFSDATSGCASPASGSRPFMSDFRFLSAWSLAFSMMRKSGCRKAHAATQMWRAKPPTIRNVPARPYCLIRYLCAETHIQWNLVYPNTFVP